MRVGEERASEREKELEIIDDNLSLSSSLKPIRQPKRNEKKKQTCLSPSLSSAPAAPRRARGGIGEDEERRKVEKERARERRERESKSLSCFFFFFSPEE